LGEDLLLDAALLLRVFTLLVNGGYQLLLLQQLGQLGIYVDVEALFRWIIGAGMTLEPFLENGGHQFVDVGGLQGGDTFGFTGGSISSPILTPVSLRIPSRASVFSSVVSSPSRMPTIYEPKTFSSVFSFRSCSFSQLWNSSLALMASSDLGFKFIYHIWRV